MIFLGGVMLSFSERLKVGLSPRSNSSVGFFCSSFTNCWPAALFTTLKTNLWWKHLNISLTPRQHLNINQTTLEPEKESEKTPLWLSSLLPLSMFYWYQIKGNLSKTRGRPVVGLSQISGQCSWHDLWHRYFCSPLRLSTLRSSIQKTTHIRSQHLRPKPLWIPTFYDHNTLLSQHLYLENLDTNTLDPSSQKPKYLRSLNLRYRHFQSQHWRIKVPQISTLYFQ